MKSSASHRQHSAGSEQSLQDIESTTSASAPDFGNERFRNIEILKYGSSLRINHVDNQFVPADPSAPRLAGDAVLTGICQLFTLRLGCQHGFVCLNDLKKQHIIAEATKTVSPYDASVHAPNDGLLFGVQSFAHTYSISQLTLPAFTRGQQHFVDNENTSINDERAIFLDLKKEPLLNSIPFIKSDSGCLFRFYLEAPLRNAAGLVVGVLAVLDDQPRSSFQDVSIQPILDAAQIVIEHLELVRLRDLNVRAERLMQGLSHFNVGQTSVDEWVKGAPSQALPPDLVAGKPMIQMTSPSQTSLTATMTKQSDVTFSATTPSTQPEQYLDGAIISPDADSTATNPVNLALRPQSLTHATNSYDLKGVKKTILTDRIQPEHDVRSKQSGSEVYETFARAASLICESMDLNGTCFLGVSSDTRTNSVSRTVRRRSPPDNIQNGDTPIPESTDSEGKFDSSDSQPGSVASDDLGLMLCECIAFTTKPSSSAVGDPSPRSCMKITGHILDKLVVKYPAGHIFQFDIANSTSSGDDSTQNPKSMGHESRRRKLNRVLSSNFPTARSLIFVPLYDYEQQKLYSAFFGWTDDIYRILVSSDAVYVAAFANSIMCEVMRLETVALEKAKYVFMSSISHELRSPLHGILAATELLRESRLKTDQNELALMVDSCGRTLLDIMNNLLEHAKINNTIENSKATRKKRKSRTTALTSSSMHEHDLQLARDPIDIAEIVEETIVSVASSHVSKIQRAEQLSGETRHLPAIVRDTETLEPNEMRAPLVVLNIHKSDDCFLYLDAGAWRRIVMNLVGNALKYTTSGHVEIGLSIDSSTEKSARKFYQVILTVSDSGLGISESYLRNKLYTPFAQENQLSPGVGLGLSIVNRLVLSLGGKIKIESELNVGTDIKVVIPLPASEQLAIPAYPVIRDTIAAAKIAIATSKSVCLCGFDILPALGSVPTGIMSSYALSLLKLKQSLSTMLNTWFEVSIELNSLEADFCIVEASYAHALLMRDPSNIVFQKRYIVIYAYESDRLPSQSWPGCSSLITSPIGPFQLARALKTAFKRRLVQGIHNNEPTTSSMSVSSDASILGTGTASIPRSSNGSSSVCTVSQVTRSVHSDSRVLLVDDNEINVRILVGLVRKLKLSYSTACNGQDALNQYITAYKQNRPFQYVFMDISMPVMDGLTSTKHIRAFEKEDHNCIPTQIFVLTGLGHVDTQDEAAASGADQYLRKPVRLNILRSLLPIA